jgi:hypothetical protein
MLSRSASRFALFLAPLLLAACATSSTMEENEVQPAASPEYWIEVQNTTAEALAITADVGQTSPVSLGDVAAGATERFRIQNPAGMNIRVMARRGDDTSLTSQVMLRAGETVRVTFE